ncbi:MAG: TonB-dependent receptor plug domain-containing protein [Bacteroides sp.]|uniref:TonB-dependent receptor n=1 Tax=Bacteroides sp. TaxID=29523 RepID=UPI002FCC08C3
MVYKTFFTSLLTICFFASLQARGEMFLHEKEPAIPEDSTKIRDDDPEKVFTLEEVVIVKQLNHMNATSKVDLKINPVNSSQEVLRTVPGLFIAQHAGGGKAEQMFLRGFDLDHGTDINISVDGMPVNMVSHAHGQGYADLHFLQPETIESVEFDKGPYNVSKGDLATAGYVSFKTKDRMDNEVSLEIGEFNTQRLRASFSFLNAPQQSFYVSSSYLLSDGYFVASQNFNRFNLMSKYTRWNDNSRFSVTLSHFSSVWNASGQIPQRAVDDGIITRFGALDDTEGGNTGRSNLNLLYDLTLANGATIRSNTWLSYYDFNLYSNFTFFLKDSINGDEINQREKRLLGGVNTEYLQSFNVGKSNWQLKAGIGFRYDRIDDLALYHTKKRQRLGTFALGDVHESSLFGYAGLNIEWGKWLINPAVRIDHFTFDYVDRTLPEYTNPKVSQAIVSPKLNFIYHLNPKLQFLLKMGKGFHSNDARVVIAEKGKSVLPAAYGVDLGILWKPLPYLILNATGWFLQMQQEFVYVGDDAVVEPSGRSRRYGIDLGARCQLNGRFYLQADYTYSHARSMDDPAGENYIPLAPVNTLMAGLSYQWKGLSVSLKGRYLGNRPANEDYTITAKGYFVADLNASYTYKRVTIGTVIENIFNTEWNEAQFATETRLQNEPKSVTELHFTPGTPFNARGFVTVRF